MNAYHALTKGAVTGDPKTQLLLYETIKNKPNKEPGKSTFYTAVVKQYTSAWEVNQSDESQEQNAWYEARYRNYEKSLTASLGSSRVQAFTMKSISSLLVGHGGVSVLETSLALHRTYGVPYIPGSAIKGLAAHYCHQVLGQEDTRYLAGGDYYTALFGSKDQAGYIIFHDAWITPDTVAGGLIQDVMTPHHQAYNSIQLKTADSSKSAAPRDDDDPVPIPFLAVSGRFRFILTSIAEGLEDRQVEEWLLIAKEIIVHALEYEGIGGKTNAGYGRMTKVEGR